MNIEILAFPLTLTVGLAGMALLTVHHITKFSFLSRIGIWLCSVGMLAQAYIYYNQMYYGSDVFVHFPIELGKELGITVIISSLYYRVYRIYKRRERLNEKAK